MKKTVYIIGSLFLIFIANICLYYFNSDYKFILQKIKYGDKLSVIQTKNITDEYVAENLTNQVNVNNNLVTNKVSELIKNEIISTGSISPISSTGSIGNTGTLNISSTGSKKEDTYDKNHLDYIIKLFTRYNLVEKKYDEYFQLFGITDDFTGKYITYVGSDFEIYFFVGSKFEELYNLFDYLSQGGDLKVNKTNNFSKQSFFINLKNDDGKVRLVFDTGIILFGLNIKKDYYNEVKQILKNF